MSESVQPALSREEWKAVASALAPMLEAADWGAEYGESPDAAIEAARLSEVIESIDRGEPFGFTWEDVQVLEATANSHDVIPEHREYHTLVAGKHRSIAARIAALLPPRE